MKRQIERSLKRHGEQATLLRTNFQDNGQGGGEEVEIEVDTFRAIVRPKSDSRSILADQDITRLNYRMICSADVDVRKGDKVELAGDKYEVLSPGEHTGAEHLEVEMELIQ